MLKRLRLPTALLIIFSLAACSDSGPSGPTPPDAADVVVDAGPAPDGVIPVDGPLSDVRPVQEDGAVDPCEGVTPVTGEPQLSLFPIIETGLTRLTDIAFPPGDSRRFFVLEQHVASIRVIKDGQLIATPYLDLKGKVSKSNEQGLLSLAFHPKYASNRRVFIYYTALDGTAKLDEILTSAGDPEKADETSQKNLLSISQPEENHNGGAVRFGPDGYLYLGVGDGGGGGDNHGAIGNAQKKDTLLGKMLRIDVDKQDPGKAYAIPAGNPFVNDADFLPEIVHWGLRNPWRFDFDRQTGDLWIGDVGQNAWEELNYVPAGQKGLNFGWRCREAFEPYTEDAHCASETFVDPVLAKSIPSDGFCSIMPGYVYRGCKMPGYHGSFFYGDYCNKQVFQLQLLGGQVFSDSTLSEISVANLTSWGQDAQGELYVVTGKGTIYRLDPR